MNLASRRSPFRAALIALAVVTLAASPAGAAQITVFAAASLKNAIGEIAENWKAATGNEAAISFAGSSALARQIQQGAPAEVFISANSGWMDKLEEAGEIQPATRRDLLRNRIVLVAHGEAPPIEIAPGFDLSALLGGGKLAMALVDAVPAGIYGKAALSSLGIWDAVAPKVAQADNVRAALAFVASGEAPYGIVYATDARAEQKVSVVGTFPENSHPPIVYPAALVNGASPTAAAFLEWLGTSEAKVSFERQGFTVIAP